MKKEIIISLIIGSLIGGMWVQYRFSGGIWSNKPSENLCVDIVEKQNRELRMMKLRICYDYNPRNGDYYWRHDNCKALEKEILEFREN